MKNKKKKRKHQLPKSAPASTTTISKRKTHSKHQKESALRDHPLTNTFFKTPKKNIMTIHRQKREVGGSQVERQEGPAD